MSHRLAAVAAAGWLLSAGLATSARADGDLESILGGFDDTPAVPDRPAATAIDPESPWRLSGEARLDTVVNYAHDAPDGAEADYRGLSKLQGGLRVALDLDWGGLEARLAGQGSRDVVYPIKKRDEFTHAVLQSYEAGLEVTELWVRASPIPKVDLKVGRQVVVWGRSDTLRVVDVLNPSDNREPGRIDLADLRLPVAMTRLDYYLGQLAFTGIAIHESRFNKEPAAGSDFATLGLPAIGVSRPANGGDDTEWAAAVSGRFQGWDASLHWARVYEDRPRLDPETGLLEHARYTLLGATGNYALGNWLLKGELARNQGLRYAAVPRRRFARSDAMLGLEYSGLRDTSVALEVVGRRLHGFEAPLEQLPDVAQRNTLETSLRYSASYQNDALHLTLLGVWFGEWGHDGAVYRASLRKDIWDGFSGELGVVVYEGGTALLDTLDDNDRLFLTFRHSF